MVPISLGNGLLKTFTNKKSLCDSTEPACLVRSNQGVGVECVFHSLGAGPWGSVPAFQASHIVPVRPRLTLSSISSLLKSCREGS